MRPACLLPAINLRHPSPHPRKNETSPECQVKSIDRQKYTTEVWRNGKLLSFVWCSNFADPDAEVIALSPKTLMATNRFVCEICNKGFQRDQNLQLHRRGHNLPWKLRQRSSKEVRKRVYVCPEPSCVHHEPSRALGDLTGIKKHFCRKHGEKKWKCDKCSKKYAVQSDWKAHSKICGTREYKCDCGTLFSRFLVSSFLYILHLFKYGFLGFWDLESSLLWLFEGGIASSPTGLSATRWRRRAPKPRLRQR